MIVKPSISFLNNDNGSKLATDVENIFTAMTGNAHYPTPNPPLVEVKGALDDYIGSMAASSGGDAILAAIKREKRATLVRLMRNLASYVQVQCEGNMAILLSSGFPVQKPQREPIGVLPPPSNLKLTLGRRSGELRATAGAVTGAALYSWKLSAASNPDVVLISVQTTGASNTFTGLTPGVVYSATINAVGSAGPSNWCDPVQQMVV